MESANVSVVIPAFNVEKYILRTINSILQQTKCVKEIVVVEDCSTDNTGHLLNQKFSDNAQIRVISNTENRGLCASRNIGINAVSKDIDYIMLVDADDLIAPYTVEILLSALLNSHQSYGLTFGSKLSINEEDFIINHPQSKPSSNEISIEDLAKKNLIGCGSGALIKKGVFRSGIVFEESLRDEKLEGCGDWLFYLMVRSKFNIKRINTPTVGYRVIDGSMSSNRVQMLKSLVKVQSIAAQRIPDELEESFQKSYFDLTILYAELAIRRLNIRALIEVLMEAQKYSNKMLFLTLNRLITKKIQSTFKKIKNNNYKIMLSENIDFYDYCTQFSPDRSLENK